MKRFTLTLLTLIALHSASSFAATASLSRAEGAPGGLVTLILSLDPVPTDSGGLFSLDIDLWFDPNIVSYEALSARKIGLLISEEDNKSDFEAAFSELSEQPFANRVRLNMGGSYTDSTGIFPRDPGAGDIVALSFRIAANAPGGEVPIQLEVFDSVDDQVSSVVNGAVAVSTTVVPIPPALALFGLPVTWLLARRRG